MTASIFTYSVQRQYPYRWFTPVTFVGGTILIVLFSLMNFVNNSYILDLQDRRDPNTTIANGVWFRNWPSYLTRSVQPICQPQELSVNSQFFTNQTGFEYTLMKVTTQEILGISNGLGKTAPSLSYFNHLLEDCATGWMEMHFDNDQSFYAYPDTTWGGWVRIAAVCNIAGSRKYSYVALSATYSPFPRYFTPGTSFFIAGDQHDRPTMFLAELLLNGLWKQTMANLSELGLGLSNSIVNVDIQLDASYTDDITSSDFFNVGYQFRTTNGSVIRNYDQFETDPMTTIMNRHESLDMYVSSEASLHSTWTAINLLGKAMYSAVITDLGCISCDPGMNLLTNHTTVQNLLSQITNTMEADNFAGFTLPYKYTYFYDRFFADLHHKAADLSATNLTPSVISTSYRCQLPKLKSGGEIFISILLADLVFLTAAWQLFTFGVGWLALDKRQSAQYCRGCLSTDTAIGEGIYTPPKNTSASTLTVVESGTLSFRSSAHSNRVSHASLLSSTSSAGDRSPVADGCVRR